MSGADLPLPSLAGMGEDHLHWGSSHNEESHYQHPSWPYGRSLGCTERLPLALVASLTAVSVQCRGQGKRP
jgi:hypothetical protein